MRQENVLAKMVSDITGLDYEILKDNIILEANELPNYIRWGALIYCDDFKDIPGLYQK